MWIEQGFKPLFVCKYEFKLCKLYLHWFSFQTTIEQKRHGFKIKCNHIHSVTSTFTHIGKVCKKTVSNNSSWYEEKQKLNEIPPRKWTHNNMKFSDFSWSCISPYVVELQFSVSFLRLPPFPTPTNLCKNKKKKEIMGISNANTARMINTIACNATQWSSEIRVSDAATHSLLSFADFPIEIRLRFACYCKIDWSVYLLPRKKNEGFQVKWSINTATLLNTEYA